MAKGCSRKSSKARTAGDKCLRRTVHGGESNGPEGVWDAVQLLGADRIDHGVRAIEDPALLALLAERQIPLGICPSSNLALGVYAALTRPTGFIRWHTNVHQGGTQGLKEIHGNLSYELVKS